MYLKPLALASLILSGMYGILLNSLSMRSIRNPIPENVSDIYDPASYRKWKSYHFERCRLGLTEHSVSLAISLILFGFNLYSLFAGLFPENEAAQSFSVLLLSSLSSLLLLPFSWYGTMVIEQRYGFNRTTVKTFWLDEAKSLGIGIVLLFGISMILSAAHRKFGNWMIPVFTGCMMVLILLFTFLYPVLSRVFNRFVPLEKGELKTKLTDLLEKHGYRVRAIQVMDASRRSTRSNAYFTGFGKMKTIVLYDTLLFSMTEDEICAVFAHELGHGLHRDTLKNQILSFFMVLAVGFLAWLTLQSESIFQAFGFESINYGFALILIMEVEFALISPLFGLVTSAFSRRAEYRADAQAVREGYGEQLVCALKKLARINFADLSPCPLLVLLEYSHPTLSQRISAIEKLEKST